MSAHMKHKCIKLGKPITSCCKFAPHLLPRSPLQQEREQPQGAPKGTYMLHFLHFFALFFWIAHFEGPCCASLPPPVTDLYASEGFSTLRLERGYYAGYLSPPDAYLMGCVLPPRGGPP